ncbi:hypothetical protein Tco_1493437 [Tanacetum coccineum]
MPAFTWVDNTNFEKAIDMFMNESSIDGVTCFNGLSSIVIFGLMISSLQSSSFFFQCFRGSSPIALNQNVLSSMEGETLQATTEYQEVIQATEDLESPAVGFPKTSDYKGGLAVQVNAVIKQNNTLLYLDTEQSQKLVELEEKFDKLKQEIHTIIEKEVQPADLEDSISNLAKRLDNFSISGKLPVKRRDGKIHVFEDPNKIFKEQFEKESKK